MKSWWHDNGVKMYSTHNEGEYVVAERFIRTLKNKIYKQYQKKYTSIKLDEISDKYNKAYHGTIKMKSTDVKLDTYTDYGIKHNDKDPKFRELMTM